MQIRLHSCFYFSTTTDRVKYKNLVRDNRVVVLIDDLVHHIYVKAEGKANIINSYEPGYSVLAHSILVKYVPDEDLAKWEKSFGDKSRVIIELTPDEVSVH